MNDHEINKYIYEVRREFSRLNEIKYWKYQNQIESKYIDTIQNFMSGDSDNIINIENYNDSDNIFSDYLYYNNYNKDKPLIIKKLPININKFNPLKYFITIMLLNIIIIFTVIHLK